jgi:hypothetical protein
MGNLQINKWCVIAETVFMLQTFCKDVATSMSSCNVLVLGTATWRPHEQGDSIHFIIIALQSFKTNVMMGGNAMYHFSFVFVIFSPLKECLLGS